MRKGQRDQALLKTIHPRLHLTQASLLVEFYDWQDRLRAEILLSIPSTLGFHVSQVSTKNIEN